MKRLFFFTIVSILFCLTANAQKSEMSAMTEMNPGASTIKEQEVNNIMLEYPTMELTDVDATSMLPLPAAKDKGYKNLPAWKHGRNLRRGGVWLTILSCIAIVPVYAAFDSKTNHNPETVIDAWGSANETTNAFMKACGVCTIPLAGGIVMWACGNSQMKKARLSYTGKGLAFNF